MKHSNSEDGQTHRTADVRLDRPRRGDLGYQVNHLARLLRQRLTHELGPLGFTSSQAAVLLVLGSSDGPLTMGSVAERLGIDRPTLTGIVRRLDRDGWVTVSAHPKDGRARLLQLTDQATASLPALGAASARVSVTALRRFNEHERAQVIDLLERITNMLEAADELEANP
jgi:MarR family transcriptional regulator for hemolysin